MNREGALPRSTQAPLRALPWLLTLTLTAGGQPATAQDLQYGQYAATLAGLAAPADVVAWPDGRLAVSEEHAHRVRIFSFAAPTSAATSQPAPPIETLRFGEFGRGDGQFDRPRGLAVTPGGELLVVDAGNHRVQAFTADGAFRRVIGGYGSGPGKFCNPLAVAADERLYVADADNRRVQVLTLDGAWLSDWGNTGPPEERLWRPVDVAVAPGGDVFVCDADRNRIVRYDRAGNIVAMWGEWGYVPGMLAEPGGLSVDAARVYVADTRNHRVQAFDFSGQRLYEWGLHAIRPREHEGRLHYPDSVALGPQLAVVGEHFENRLQLFTLETPAQAAARFNPLPPGSGPPAAHFGAFMDLDGDWMAVTEPDSHSVLIYDLRGREPINIHTLGGYGSNAGRFVRPVDVHISQAARRLTVLEAGNQRLQEFELRPGATPELQNLPRMSRLVRSADLAQLSRGVPLLAQGQLLSPSAVERDSVGNFYLLDGLHHFVAVFDPGLRFVRAFGGLGEQPGQFRSPCDLALDPAERSLYVLDGGNHRVQRFDLTPGGDPAAVLQFGTRGTGDGQFERPAGIAVAPDGRILVSDFVLDRVQSFAPDGTFQRAFGKRGLGASEFYRPGTLAFDRAGQLWLIDFGNHRGQIFSPDGAFQRAFGARLFVDPTRTRQGPAE